MADIEVSVRASSAARFSAVMEMWASVPAVVSIELSTTRASADEFSSFIARMPPVASTAAMDEVSMAESVARSVAETVTSPVAAMSMFSTRATAPPVASLRVTRPVSASESPVERSSIFISDEATTPGTTLVASMAFHQSASS